MDSVSDTSSNACWVNIIENLKVDVDDCVITVVVDVIVKIIVVDVDDNIFLWEYVAIEVKGLI